MEVLFVLSAVPEGAALGAQLAAGDLEFLGLASDVTNNSDVGADDDDDGNTEAQSEETVVEGDVGRGACQVVEGAADLESLGDVAAPAEHRRRRPEQGPCPDDEDLPHVTTVAGDPKHAERFDDD